MKLTSMRTTTLKASAAVIFALPSLVGLPLLLLSGCSSEPAKTTTQQAAVKDPEYLTGHVAFQKMYVASRGWARDAQGFRLASVQSKDSHGHDGKSGIWTAAFASGTLHSSKPYIWSGSSAPDAPERGVTWGSDDSYSPTNSSTHVFDVAFLKTDSDSALETALKHGGSKLMEKESNQPVMYLLEWDGPSNALLWHVIFGTSRTMNQLQIVVNASSGEFVRVEK